MIRIVTRSEPSAFRENILRLLAVACALAAAAVFMALMGYNPFDIYAKMIAGSLKSAYRFKETINKTIPLVVLSLGIAIAFRMKFWNIGAEGQFYLGAYGASLVAFTLPSLPAIILLPLMFVVAFSVRRPVGPRPRRAEIAFFRKRDSGHPHVELRRPQVDLLPAIRAMEEIPEAKGFPKIATFDKSAILPDFLGIHVGWVITLVLVAIMYVVLIKKTKLGYEIDVLGESEATARYAGMSVTRITIVAILISGGLCGIAGMMQASAIEHSLSEQLSGGLGFTAVITTWLARLSPPVIVIVSFLFSVLLQGGSFLQSSLQIPSSVADILQGIIIFFVLGSEFFVRYRFTRSAPGEAK